MRQFNVTIEATAMRYLCQTSDQRWAAEQIKSFMTVAANNAAEALHEAVDEFKSTYDVITSEVEIGSICAVPYDPEAIEEDS